VVPAAFSLVRRARSALGVPVNVICSAALVSISASCLDASEGAPFVAPGEGDDDVGGDRRLRTNGLLQLSNRTAGPGPGLHSTAAEFTGYCLPRPESHHRSRRQ
jgi:hypothetical protein